MEMNGDGDDDAVDGAGNNRSKYYDGTYRRRSPSTSPQKGRASMATNSKTQGAFLKGVVIAFTKSSYDSLSHAKRRIAAVTRAGGIGALYPPPETTIVLCGDSIGDREEIIDRIKKKKDLKGVFPPKSASWVKCAWLVDSLKAKHALAIDSYMIGEQPSTTTNMASTATPAPWTPRSEACVQSSSLHVQPSRAHTTARVSNEQPLGALQQRFSVLRRHHLSPEGFHDAAIPSPPRDLNPRKKSKILTMAGVTDEDPSEHTTNTQRRIEARRTAACPNYPHVSLPSFRSPGQTSMRTLSRTPSEARRQRDLTRDGRVIESVRGTGTAIIDLPPDMEARYFCYNCGDKSHGAINCTLPLRGTPENPFVPDIKGARKKCVGKEWVCARPHPLDMALAIGPNDDILRVLQQLHDTYADFEDPKQQMKALQLSKALSYIKGLKKRIGSYDEALKLPNVGKGTAEKIQEILETGTLQRLSTFDTPESRAIKLFSSIYGVGNKTARKFVERGYRTVEDLRRDIDTLTETQKIGLALHEELQERIPRDEVHEIVEFVKRRIARVNPDCIFEACGSYRRGKPMCGDVDILVSHRDPLVCKKLFSVVIPDLHDAGLLTHDLMVSDGESTQEKYLGIGKLPTSPCHRRIDIIVVPWIEWPCAILYFTGSGHFNRSMRLLANKCGWSLSQHYMHTDVLRVKQLKITQGDMIPIKSEHDIFALLALPYLEPTDRNA